MRELHGRSAWLLLLAPVALAAAGSSDPLWKSEEQWGLQKIGWSASLARGATAPVIVAVIDTGIDYFHPDLPADALWENPKETLNGKDDDGNGYVDDLAGWNFVDGNGNPFDTAGHGTIVAGILAAGLENGVGIAGMAPKAQVMPLKVLSFAGRGRASQVAAAIYYAADQGARVINLSLGGDGLSKLEARAIAYATGKGAVVVAAAGNAGRDVGAVGPGGLPGVITVGASGPDDAVAAFSNTGAEIDLVAPGVDIVSLRARRTDVSLVAGLDGYVAGSAFVGPDAHYYRVSGTSFSAPFVSGAAALLLAENPSLTPEQVKRVLLQSAKEVGAPGVDVKTGYGRLDLRAAMAASPDAFVEARIDKVAVAKKDDAQVVVVTGTAAADAFAGAEVELGAGEDPTSWKPVGTVPANVVSGVLAEIPVSELAGGKVFTLRLRTKHQNGKEREARFRLNVGG